MRWGGKLGCGLMTRTDSSKGDARTCTMNILAGERDNEFRLPLGGDVGGLYVR